MEPRRAKHKEHPSKLVRLLNKKLTPFEYFLYLIGCIVLTVVITYFISDFLYTLINK